MKTKEVTKTYIDNTGCLRIQISTISFYVHGTKEDIFGNEDFVVSYFRNLIHEV